MDVVANGEISWDEYKRFCNDFIKISNQINDGWQFIQHDDDSVGNQYLMKKIVKDVKYMSTGNNIDFEELDGVVDPASIKSTLNPNTTPLTFEYHVLYSLAYCVPVLYFNAYKSDGSLLTVQEAWEIFDANYKTKIDMLATLTQMEHPILFKPFLTLHPCRTKEFLGLMNQSSNKIITFLSTIGPAVHLKMDLNYGLGEGGSGSSVHND